MLLAGTGSESWGRGGGKPEDEQKLARGRELRKVAGKVGVLKRIFRGPGRDP